MIKPIRLLIVGLIPLITLPNLSFAGVSGCGCYCGKVLPPPCSDDACKRACGWQEPSGGGGYSGPSQEEIERQRQEEEWRRQEEERQRLEAERLRQQDIEEQQKKEEEEARRRDEEFNRKKEEALRDMKGISADDIGLKGTDTGELGLKDMGDSGANSLGLKGIEDVPPQKPAASPKVSSNDSGDVNRKSMPGIRNKKEEPKKSDKDSKPKEKNVQKVWQKALVCAMEEVYARSESLGAAGKRFSQDLRSEMKRVISEAGKSVKDTNNVNIVDLKLDRQVSAGSGHAERQFIVEVAVHSKGNGNVDVDVQSYFSQSVSSKERQENIQSFMVIDKTGNVAMGENSAAVDACLAR